MLYYTFPLWLSRNRISFWEKKRESSSISPFEIFPNFPFQKTNETYLSDCRSRRCHLCYRCSKKKQIFYLDCSGAVLGPWYTTTAVSLAVGACSDLSASRLLLPLPPVRLRLDPFRCPVPMTRIVSVILLLPAWLRPCESSQISYWYFNCEISLQNCPVNPRNVFVCYLAFCVRINGL